MDEILHDPGTDAEAVAAVRRGDAERYRELVERHERRVFAVAWSRLGDAALAEEATQEAFIRGYRRLWLLGDGAKFSSWIASVARNVAINLGLRHRRELKKRERWALEHPGASDEHRPETETDPLHSPEVLRQTLAELPTAHRECLVLFYLEGKSGAEAAATLGISEAALRVRLHRARAALREQLEKQLTESLRKLGPSKSIVPAVMAMVLLSTSAKAVTAGGVVSVGASTKLLASLSKFAPFALFFPLLQVLFSVPGLLLALWVSRLEQRNFRDAHGFRVQLHRKYYRSFLWGFPLLLLAILLPQHFARAAWGMKGMYLFTLTLVGGLTLMTLRSLVINRNPFQIGMVVYCVILVVGILVQALDWLPMTLGQLPMIVASCVFLLILNKRPVRMDYSLFLRAAQGLLKANAAPPAVIRPQLRRADLLGFARFLGSRWLVVNHRWETAGLGLQLSPVKISFWNRMNTAILPMARNYSGLVLRPDASVLATCSEADAAELSERKEMDVAQLESTVCATVQEAWQEFRAGNPERAEQLLGERPEAEVFVVPTARSAATRWLRIWLGLAVVLMLVAMSLSWRNQRLRMVSGRRLQPVAATEAEVRASLALQGDAGVAGSNAWQKVERTWWPVELLPPRTLFDSHSWAVVPSKLLAGHLSPPGSPASVDRLLDSSTLLRAFINDWLTLEQLGFTTEQVREKLRLASRQQLDLWFVPRETAARTRDAQDAGYQVLFTEEIARRVLTLKKLDCLEAVNGAVTVEILLQHQVRSEQLLAGRRSLPFPKLAHGLFWTMGSDPLQDTYHALVILDGFGALGRVDREACVRGILRFHHGKGLFGSVKQGDGFVISGDSRDTFWAYEALRLLGALDQVRDLSQWQFRPQFSLAKKPEPADLPRLLTWSEIEAWVLQQRLARVIREQAGNANAPARSLLEP